MTEISITSYRQSRYIDKMVYEDREHSKNNAPCWIPGKGFEELIQQFIRNKVFVAFATAYFEPMTYREDKLQDIEKWIEELKAFCDGMATGLWTFHHVYSRKAEFDTKTGNYTYFDTGSGRLMVHFENEQDVATFLNTYPGFQK